MSFFQHNMLTSLTSKFDEQQWVKQVRQTLDEELDKEIETPVSIFAVPKALMITDPDSYIPQQVAIGPYHHLRLELYDMERYKVAAAKRNQKNIKLHHLVDHLSKSDIRVRACYHRPVSFGTEALAWMLALDASFLFEFLQVCGIKEGKILTKVPSRLAHLIDLSGNKTTHNIILRDIMMLENQLPLFVLRMLLELHFSSLEIADENLITMLLGVSKDISPFQMADSSSQNMEINEFAHLLDFLYHYIVPRQESSSSFELEIEPDDDDKETPPEEEESFAKPSDHLKQFLHTVWRLVSALLKGPIQVLKRLIFSKPLKVIIKLPWTILTKIPIIKMFKEPVENMLGALHNKEKDDEEAAENKSMSTTKPPLQEEIAIPSVSQLVEAGVQFFPAKEGISSLDFDPKTLSFHVPIVKLDVNSEVVLRNLVAYEASCVSGPLVLIRYTELMNGIIDTDVDAKLLCQRGIIVNHLKSEKEVADLWNGMSKSVRLTKVPSLDRVIGDVNMFYSGRWRVKMGKFMREYVFGSWKFLTFFAAIAMLLLMVLQAFCQVYSCSRILPIKALEPTTTAA
ncbi:hypothetical protein ACS0TY_035015 [Phlomoides rotata]